MTHNNMNQNKLLIIPYVSAHGKIILESQMNHNLSQLDAEYIKESANLEEKNMAFTCVIGDKIVASAGIKKIWNGVGEGWVLATSEIWNHPITIAKAIKKNFDKVAIKNNIKRVQTAVNAQYGIGIRFAKWLGLSNEGLMKCYGLDGSDHYRFARIF
jgi:hypothetical protein